MPSRDDVDQQLSLLRIHRRTLRANLETAGKFGNNIPTSVKLSIDETRESINRIKNILQQWGVDVEDHPDDTAPAYVEAEKTAIPAGTRIGIEFESNTKVLVMPLAVFKIFQKAMERDYGVDISEFVVAE